MSTLKVNEIRHLSNTGTRNIELETNGTTNLQATSTLGLTVVGTLSVSGLSTFTGDMVVGNAITDTVDLQSKVTGFNNFSGFTGEIRMYAGNEGPNAPPSGWLYCNGDTISETTGDGGTHYNADGKGNDYELLFNLLKTNSNWGNSGSPTWGNSSTGTVKLPDFRSRSPVGVNTGAANTITSGLTARLIGATSGTETHALSIAELPVHNHGQNLNTSLSATGQTTNVTWPTYTANQSTHSHTVDSHTHSMTHVHQHSHSHGMSHYHDIAELTAFDSSNSGAHTHTSGSFLHGRTGVTNNQPAVGGDTNNYGQLTSSQHTGHTHIITVPSHDTADSSENYTAATYNNTETTAQRASGTSYENTTGGTGLTTNDTDPTITVSLTANTGSVTLGGETHRHTLTTTDIGSGTAHTNLSPIIAVNYIIKV